MKGDTSLLTFSGPAIVMLHFLSPNEPFTFNVLKVTSYFSNLLWSSFNTSTHLHNLVINKVKKGSLKDPPQVYKYFHKL